jgi:hypothetical protein
MEYSAVLAKKINAEFVKRQSMINGKFSEEVTDY